MRKSGKPDLRDKAEDHRARDARTDRGLVVKSLVSPFPFDTRPWGPGSPRRSAPPFF